MWKRWNKDTHIWEKSVDNGLNWTVLPINASTITEGTIADARIPTNIPRMNVINPGSMGVESAYREGGRSIPLGYWQDIPFNPANFAAEAPMVWTVGSAAYIRNRYTIVGKTLFWSLYIAWFLGGNVLSGSPSPYIYIAGIPSGPAGAQLQTFDIAAGIAGIPDVCGLISEPTGSGLRLRKPNGTNFALTDTPGFVTTVVLEIG